MGMSCTCIVAMRAIIISSCCQWDSCLHCLFCSCMHMGPCMQRSNKADFVLTAACVVAGADVDCRGGHDADGRV